MSEATGTQENYQRFLPSWDGPKAVIAAILAALLIIIPLRAGNVQLTAPVVTAPVAGASIPVGTMTVSGTATPNSDVEVFVDGASVGKVHTGADGAWSLDVPIATAGQHSVQAQALDASGQVVAEGVPMTITATAAEVAQAPTAVPAPQLVAPSVDATVQSVPAGSVTLHGTGTPNSTVEVYVNGQKVGTAPVGADGTWSLPTDLKDGIYAVYANALDQAGKAIATGVAARILVGPVSPAVVQTSITSPAYDAALPAGEVTVTGTGLPNSQVEILVNDQVIGTAPVGADGTWQLPVTLPASAAVILARPVGDSVAAAVPINGATAMLPGAVASSVAASTPQAQGAAPGVNATTQPVPAGNVTLTGTGAPNSTVEVFVNGKSVGTATVSADGTWSLPITLQDGVYAVYATTTGQGGTAQVTGIPVRVLVGAVSPAVVQTSITSPSYDADVPVGETTVTGTGLPNSQVEILVNDQVVGTAPVGADGAWQLPVTLPSGPVVILARPVGDSVAAAVPINGATSAILPGATAPVAGGGTGAAAAPTAVVLGGGTDTGVAPVITSPSNNAQVRPGNLTIEGTGEPNSVIEIWSGGVILGTVTVGADGTWSYEVTPGTGPVTYEVRSAGSTNPGTSVTVNYPAIQPPVAAGATATPAAGAAGGTSATGTAGGTPAALPTTSDPSMPVLPFAVAALVLLGLGLRLRRKAQR